MIFRPAHEFYLASLFHVDLIDFLQGRPGLGPKPRRTDTSMTQYGSSPLLIPDVKEVDMEQAIACKNSPP